MTAPLVIGGPHLHSLFTVPRTMLAVLVCLTPATLFGLYQFGWPAVLLFGVTIASSLLWEVVCLLVAGRPVARFATDGSAFVTGWLIALTLPPWAPWWVGFIGAGIAIVIAKHMFGGLGQNLFNPAMVARAMLLIALPVEMTTWVAPLHGSGPDFASSLAITFSGGGFDAVSSASTLGHLKSQLDAGLTMPDILRELPQLRAHVEGLVSGSLGETSAFLLFLGGMCLVLLRIISIVTPLFVLGSLAAISGAAWLVAPSQFPPPQYHLASGAIMLCAFFIATDYVTAPMTSLGKAIYGLGIGSLVFIIRSWGSFPEGVAFAVLLMNACTPLIDTYTRPRIFGRTRSGKPLELGGKP